MSKGDIARVDRNDISGDPKYIIMTVVGREV